MSVLKNIATAGDNTTFSVGRVLGIIVFAVFIIGLPSISIALMAMDKVDVASVGTLFEKLEVYIPAILLSVAGLIGITAKSDQADPK